VRTTLFSLAVILTAAAGQAREKPKDEKSAARKHTYHVYSTGCRLGQVLRGSYATAEEAIAAAADFRTRISFTIEVAAGTDGKRQPDSKPSRYHVYAWSLRGNFWYLRQTFADENKAKEAEKALLKEGRQAEVVLDYKPHDSFLVHGGGCRRSWRLLGAYCPVEEACDAAKEFRARKLRCEVTVDEAGACRKPLEYRIFVRGCKSGWALRDKTRDAKKAQEIVQSRTKAGDQVELVRYFFGR
jgi:hypothetical protein